MLSRSEEKTSFPQLICIMLQSVQLRRRHSPLSHFHLPFCPTHHARGFRSVPDILPAIMYAVFQKLNHLEQLPRTKILNAPTVEPRSPAHGGEPQMEKTNAMLVTYSSEGTITSAQHQCVVTPSLDDFVSHVAIGVQWKLKTIRGTLSNTRS